MFDLPPKFPSGFLPFWPFKAACSPLLLASLHTQCIHGHFERTGLYFGDLSHGIKTARPHPRLDPAYIS